MVNDKFENLIGKGCLSGIDRETIALKKCADDEYGDDAEHVTFILNDTVFQAIEDPSDGYRSSMYSFKPVNQKVKNTFDKVEVFCIHKTHGRYSGDDDILQIYNMKGGLILEIGTSNIDDYYPSFVSNFSAEELDKGKNQ